MYEFYICFKVVEALLKYLSKGSAFSNISIIFLILFFAFFETFNNYDGVYTLILCCLPSYIISSKSKVKAYCCSP